MEYVPGARFVKMPVICSLPPLTLNVTVSAEGEDIDAAVIGSAGGGITEVNKIVLNTLTGILDIFFAACCHQQEQTKYTAVIF